MNLERSDVSKFLVEILERKPDKAERFTLEDEVDVDMLFFTNRPYQGANSIITNGVSRYCENKPFEFVLTFSPETLNPDVDLFAFMATYLQLHYMPNHRAFESNDYFSIEGSIIKGLDFNGIWATEPRYFPSDTLRSLKGTEFLWLVPLYKSETNYISNNGIDAFEDYLQEKDPDLCLFNRSALSV